MKTRKDSFREKEQRCLSENAKRKAFALALGAALLLPVTAKAADPVKVNNWAELKAALESGSSVTATQNITALSGEKLSISSNSLSIDGGKNILSANGALDSAFITLDSAVNQITFKDISITSTNRTDGSDTDYVLKVNNSTSSLLMIVSGNVAFNDNHCSTTAGGVIRTYSGLQVTSLKNKASFTIEENSGGGISSYSLPAGAVAPVSIDVTNLSIKNNSGNAYGVAIYVDGNLSLTAEEFMEITENSAVGNLADTGGAIRAVKADVANIRAGSLNLTNNLVKNTTTDPMTGSNGDTGGAVIYINADTSIKTSAEMDISGNKAVSVIGTAAGGAVSATNVTLNAGTSLTVVSNDVTGATNAYGGALFVNSADISAAAINITGNTATANTGKVRGGAIDSLKEIRLNASDKISISGNSVKSSGENAKGGAFMTQEGPVSISAKSIEIKGNSAAVNNTTSATTGITSSPAYGGAIYSAGNITLHASEDITISENTVSATSPSTTTKNTASTARPEFDSFDRKKSRRIQYQQRIPRLLLF